MKKSFKYISLCGIFLLGLSLITFTACGGDDEGNQPKGTENGAGNDDDDDDGGGVIPGSINIQDLYGTWETVTYDGKAIDLGKEEDWPKWDKFEFKEDGSFNGWSINYNGDELIRGRQEHTKLGKWAYDATTKKAKLYDLVMGYHEVKDYLNGKTDVQKIEMAVTLGSLSATELKLIIPGRNAFASPVTVVMRKTNSGGGDDDEEVDDEWENEASNIAVVEEDLENIRFVIRNEAHNWQAIIQAYEFVENSPRIELIVEALNPQQKAKITANDMQHTNFWEQAFMRYTEQAAGEAMTAQDNVKRLTISGVMLRQNQFADYEEIHEITIDGLNDFRIPAGCFQNVTHLEALFIGTRADIALGKNCLPSSVGFTVYVSTDQQYEAVAEYQRNSDCRFGLEWLK